MILQDYLKRLSDLTIELDNYKAALIVLSIENDPISVISILRSTYWGTLDQMTDDLYANYAIYGMDFSHVKVAMQYIEQQAKEYGWTHRETYVTLDESNNPHNNLEGF